MGPPDIIIVGAGIIGVSLALELRERGARVTVLDRSMPGQEASTAAAGMLAAADPETPVALRDFAMESARVYPDFVAKVERLSDISVDFRRHGTIILSESDGQHTIPCEYRSLTGAEIAAMEPCLMCDGHSAYGLAEDSVDPVLLMRATVRAAEIAGVEIQSGMSVVEIKSAGSQVEVIGDGFRLAAKTVVDCRGAWSGAPVIPRKGQMLYLQPQRPGLLQHAVRAPRAYIVPRSSGRILIGTTVEDAGFDKTVHRETIERLHQAAARYVPELASASISESWAGLRPGTPDDLPILGPTSVVSTGVVSTNLGRVETGPSEIAGLFIASGHFRNGILLAPLTAVVMANVIEGKPAGVEMAAFSPSRFAAARVNKAS